MSELSPAETEKLRDRMRPVVAKYSVAVGQETMQSLQAELTKVRSKQ